jgi:hypothetical protein
MSKLRMGGAITSLLLNILMLFKGTFSFKRARTKGNEMAGKCTFSAHTLQECQKF